MLQNPLMLAGLGGAAVPFALHMLNRARYRRVEWGAMMFLEGDGTNEERASRLKRGTLLGMRMAAVALLAVALARPIVGGEPGGASADARATVAIVVDCSASTGYDEGGRTRMDLVRGAVLRILSGLRRGDEAVLIVAGGKAGEQTGRPTADIQSVAARVADLETTDATANLADAMTTALNVLDRQVRGQRQLYVVCDRQAASWGNVTDNFASAWRDRVAKSTPLERFAVVPVGGGGNANVGVESIEMASLPVIRGIENQIEVKIRNYGDQARVNVPVSVASEQRELAGSVVNIPARGMTTMTVPLTFGLRGAQIVSATIKGRGLIGDDRVAAVIDVVDPIRTLVLTDDRSDYVRAALAPYRSAGRRGSDPAMVDVMRPQDVNPLELTRYQVIVLANVAAPSEALAQAVDKFVAGGGALLVALGDQVRADVYNTALYRNGTGVLPAALGTADDEVADAPLQIDAIGHPVFRFLTGQSESVPSGAVTRRMSAAPAALAQVLARLASGVPYLIERAYGRGRVLLVTGSLGTDWGTLPRTAFYVPFVQSAVRHLAAAGMDKRNLKTGEEIVATFNETLEGRATVTLPDGGVATPDALTIGGRTQLRYTGTRERGMYSVRARTGSGTSVMPFVVRAGAEESDLTPLPAERWDRLAGSLGFSPVERAEDAVPAAEASSALWLPLLLAVVGVLVLEMGLSRWWSATR